MRFKESACALVGKTNIPSGGQGAYYGTRYSDKVEHVNYLVECGSESGSEIRAHLRWKLAFLLLCEFIASFTFDRATCS